MKKTKLLSALLAVVMVFSIMAVGAFANPSTQNFTNVEFTVAEPLTKTVTLPAGATTSPAETYRFNLVPGAAEANFVGNSNEAADGQTHQEPVLAGVALTAGGSGAVGNDGRYYEIAYDGTDSGTDLVKSLNLSATMGTVPTPGIYHYVLTEVAGDLSYETYSQASYDIYVTVGTNGDVLSAHARQKTNDAGEAGSGAKACDFENVITDTALHVTKTVTGNIGDQEKLFTFTLHTTPNAQYPAGTVINCTLPNDAGTTTCVVGTDLVFTLKHGQQADFTNFPISVEYTVTENDYTADGYTTKVNATPDAASATNGFVCTGTADNTEDTAAFVNDRSNTDTGVDMGSVSGAIAAVVAGVSMIGAGAWVSKKKHED